MVWVWVFPSLAAADPYLITVVDARIATKKADGKRWDLGLFKSPLPDAFVELTVGGVTLKTPYIRNTHLPRWNMSRTFNTQLNDKVVIVVRDRDRITSHDLIGKTDLTLKQLMKTKTLVFGQVLALRIKVVSLAAKKTPPVVRRRTAPPKRRVVRRVPPRPRPRARIASSKSQKIQAFCLSMIRHSLGCMKSQQNELLQSGNKRNLRIAAVLDKAIKQTEQALREKGRALDSMMVRCHMTIKREGWVVSQKCIQCARKQGCVRSSQLKSACRNVCLTKDAAKSIPTAPSLTPPPARRADARKKPVRPAIRRAVPARRTAAPTKRAAPVKKAPAKRVAPAKRAAPVKRAEPAKRPAAKPAPAKRAAPRRAAPVKPAERPAPAKRSAAPVKRPAVRVVAARPAVVLAQTAERPVPVRREPAPKARPAKLKAAPAKPAPKKVEAKKAEAKNKAPTKAKPKKVEAKKALPLKAPARTKPVSRPVAKGMTPAAFCKKFVAQRLGCLSESVKSLQGSKRTKSQATLMAAVLARYTKDKAKHEKRCAAGLEKEGKSRVSAKKAALTPAKIQACWTCLQQAGCDAGKQRGCKKACTE